jgi:hypothetical protein
MAGPIISSLLQSTVQYSVLATRAERLVISQVVLYNPLYFTDSRPINDSLTGGLGRMDTTFPRHRSDSYWPRGRRLESRH